MLAIRAAVFGAVSFSAVTLVWAQDSQSSVKQEALSALSQIKTRAAAGVTTTFSSRSTKTGEESLCRMYLKEGMFRVDCVFLKFPGEAIGENSNVVSITKISSSGKKSEFSGSAELPQDLTPLQALDELASPNPLKMTASTGDGYGAFSHMGWRYGWRSRSWMNSSLTPEKISVAKDGDLYTLQHLTGSDTNTVLEVESGSSARVKSRTSTPIAGVLTPLVELSFKETSQKEMVFSQKLDYSKIPEALLAKEDTADHKVPRGKEETLVSYSIIDEKFGHIDDKSFEINLAPGSMVTDSSTGRSSRLIDGKMREVNDSNEVIPESSSTMTVSFLAGLAAFSVIGCGAALVNRRRKA